MKRWLFIFVSFFFLLSCNANAENEMVWEQYGNENGEIKLTELNDSLVRVVFSNNDGFTFDTTGRQTVVSTRLNLDSNGTFIQIGTGGIEKVKNGLWVHDFTSIAQLQMKTQISDIYSRMFYNLSEEIEITGRLDGNSKGKTVNGIYLPLIKIMAGRYYQFKGRIKREPYPMSYYSTESSPQGIFSDTSKTQYRLCFDSEVQIELAHPIE